MKRLLHVLWVFILLGLGSCHTNQSGNVLVTRSFPTSSWERFDFVENTIVLSKPVSYNLDLDVLFDDSYTFNYFSVVFTVFDDQEHPLRTKEYKFNIKDRDGQWKSEKVDGKYHFRFPINSALTMNEPGTYVFQLENHMPITPLLGINEISVIIN